MIPFLVMLLISQPHPSFFFIYGILFLSYAKLVEKSTANPLTFRVLGVYFKHGREIRRDVFFVMFIS